MKKFKIYIMMLLAVGLSACTEDFNEGIAGPQTNPQEDPQVVEGFTIVKDADFSSAIVLAELEKGTLLTAVKATATPDIADGASVTFRLQLSGTENFANALALNSINAENGATVSVEDLGAAIIELFGKAPEARTAYLRAYVYILDGTSASMVPDPVDLGTITVTPEAPFIDSAYYLVGGPTGWNGEDVSTLMKFSHSGNDVYDDPYFSLLVEIGDDGGWKIVPQSAVTAVENGEADNIWGAAMGTEQDGDTSLEGVFGSDFGGAMKIANKGWAKITLNLMESTYTVEEIGEMSLELYVPGGYQGWSPSNAPTIYSKGFDMKYEGYINIAGSGWNDGFKFVNGPDWPNPENNNYKDYGTDPDKEAGNLMGTSNVSVDEAGYYRITVDLSQTNYTYTATKTDWYIVGDATVGGWTEADSTPLVYDSESKTWSVTTNLLGSKNFKFFANQAWDINLGGDLNDLSYGGSDIPVADDGEYTITLDLSDPKQYKATVVKNSVTT